LFTLSTNGLVSVVNEYVELHTNQVSRSVVSRFVQTNLLTLSGFFVFPEVDMDAKSIFLSKTFWFNLLALLVIVANVFGFAEFSRDPIVDQYALVIVTIVNIVLRFATKQPVKV